MTELKISLKCIRVSTTASTTAPFSASGQSTVTCGAGTLLRKPLTDLGAAGRLLALAMSLHYLSSAERSLSEFGTLEVFSANSILPSEPKRCKQTWRSHGSKMSGFVYFIFLYYFLFYETKLKLGLMEVLCIFP